MCSTRRGAFRLSRKKLAMCEFKNAGYGHSVANETEAARRIEGRTPGAESGRKLLGALLAFSETDPVWSVADLANHVGVPTSTMYRYVALLREMGLVDGAGVGHYRLTDRVVGLARAVEMSRTSLIEVARPHMVDLRDAIDETVILVRRGGTYAYCVDRVESTHPVRLQFDPGQAMPIHAGSASRVLLAAMPHNERENLLAEVRPGLAPQLATRLTDAALTQVAKAGWTESFEEVDEGIWGCAAAISDTSGVIASLGTAGPIFRLNEDRRRMIIERMRDSARQITRQLNAPAR